MRILAGVGLALAAAVAGLTRSEPMAVHEYSAPRSQKRARPVKVQIDNRNLKSRLERGKKYCLQVRP